MYLFTRRGRLVPGRIQQSLEWADKVTDKVNQVGGFNAGLYMSFASPRANEIIFATNVQSLGQLEDGQAKLLNDQMFLDLSDQSIQYLTQEGLTDSLSLHVHGNVDPVQQGVTHVSVVQSTIEPGNLKVGTEIGIEIANMVTKVTGAECAFLSDTTGTYGGVRWITSHESIQSLQDAGEKLNADQKFIKYIDEHAAGVYLADQARISRRLK